jgi:hypothetical protein
MPRTGSVRRRLVAALTLGAVAAASITVAHAEQPAAVCARIGTDDALRPIPESLVPAVNATFGTVMPTRVAVDTTMFRCADGHVLVCTVGANLPCGRANTSRTPGPGMVDWCREHPDADSIPAVATGHDTIYAWQCRDGAPQIGRQIDDIDARGFIAQYWRELR